MACAVRPLKIEQVSGKCLDEKGPESRSGHRIVIDENGKYLYSWGGYNKHLRDIENTPDTAYPLLKELWRYQIWTKTWQKLKTYGDVPAELASHTVLIIRNHLLQFGGTGNPFGERISNNLYDLDLNTLQWKLLKVTNGTDDEDINNMPRAKYGHTMTLVDSCIYIIGGTCGYVYDLSIHKFDLHTRKWEQVTPNSKYIPEPRYRHEVVHFDGKLYMFGGGTGGKCHELAVIDIFDLHDKAWHSVSTQPYCTEAEDNVLPLTGYPAKRCCHSCTRYQNDMYMCGGLSCDQIKDDVWKFHLPSLQWTKLQVAFPCPVYFHSTEVTHHGCLMVFGGVWKLNEERTNKIQSIWLHVPTLQVLCWNIVIGNISIPSGVINKHTLLSLGVPQQILETVL